MISSLIVLAGNMPAGNGSLFPYLMELGKCMLIFPLSCDRRWEICPEICFIAD